MKEESISKKPVILDPITAQTNVSNPSDGNTQIQSKENSNVEKLKQLPVKTIENQYTATPESSNFANDDNCVLPPSSVPGCKTKDFTIADNVTINMPATVKNPLNTIAIVTFTRTVCFDPSSGNATVSYRNVIASSSGGDVEGYWATLNSPALDEAVNEYYNIAANKMENMMTTKFLQENPDIDVFESRYFKGLCYITCIYKDADGTLKSAKTSCGDKCCKRVRKINRKPKGNSYTVLLTEYFETGGNCIGNTEVPCKNAIKVTSICNHFCTGEGDEVIPEE